MKPNVFKVTAVFFFKSGLSKKVDWIEDKLMKKEPNPEKPDSVIQVPLELHEMEIFLESKFKEWKENGKAIVRKNIKGERSLIPFSEVEYATFKVEQINEKQEEKPSFDIRNHPAHPNNYRK